MLRTDASQTGSSGGALRPVGQASSPRAEITLDSLCPTDKTPSADSAVRDRDDRISLCDSGTLHGTAHGTPYPAPPEALSDRAPRGARSSYPSCRPAGTRTASRCGLLTPTVSIAHYGCVATVVWYEWVCGTALRRDVVTASAVRPRNMTNARHEAGPLAERRPARHPCRHHVPDTRPTDGVQRTLLRSTGCNSPSGDRNGGERTALGRTISGNAGPPSARVGISCPTLVGEGSWSSRLTC